jgi:hypothetical protein
MVGAIGLLLAACGQTTAAPVSSSSPSASPSVLASPFVLAWEQECGLGSMLPPAGYMGQPVVPPVSGGVKDGQVWAAGLMRGLALEKWADANNQDTVVGSGCLKGVTAAQADILAIARAKAINGHVAYEPGSITSLKVMTANAKEMAAGTKADLYVIEASGVGPSGLWVVDPSGIRTAVGPSVADGAPFSVLYLGHYDAQTGIWVQSAILACSQDMPC